MEALSRIADSYRMLNQIQAAHSYYQQAVRERKVQPNTILEHAHVLKALSRYEEAKQWYLLYARDHDNVVGNHYAQSCDFAMAQAQVDAGFNVQSLNINSPVADFGPTTPSAGQLVFNSARTAAGQAFDGQAKNKPYVAAVGPDGSLQQAFELQTGYTDAAGNVGPVSYTPDGRQVIFTRNNFTSGTRMIPEAGISLNLMIADVNQNGTWVNPRPLPFNGTDFSTGYGTFSSDGNAIYFCSNRPEGYGGYDIYRAQRQGQSWEAVPENLGTVVNSVGDEITPFFDGASLYFSSDWHHGLGEYDVFRAEVVNNRPTTLYHMGKGINSDRDDLGFIYDPVTNSGYVVSNRIGGSGQEDVYRVGRASTNTVLLVQSAQDGQFIPGASVDMTSCGGQVYATDAGGRYVLLPTTGLNCDVVIGAPGFQSVRIPVQSMTPDAQNIIRVSLSPAGSAPGTGPLAPGTYRGVVTNAQTGAAIPNANVQIIQRNTGQVTNLVTDAYGAYTAPLQAYTTYDLMIMAPGYETVRFPVTNNDGSDPNVLGNMTMLPGTGGGGTGGAPTFSQVDGYSVQLASLGKSPDLSKFDNVSNLGRVYSVNTGGAHKVRIGVFATRAEAAAAAAQAKASYGGAFVVPDNGNSAFASTGGGGSTYTPPPTTTPPVATSGRYKVQLGAFGKPQNFDRNKASQLGILETTTRGPLTLFMIGGLNTLGEARGVQSRAQSMGYSGAFVLEDVNGQLVKVK
ncbi:MAG: carboxypeptidase regulatory-like domain-containing protein [Bacteroidota bacterium]